MKSASITTSAKINLGLEILGRRDDGYHEIRTVLCMLELCDDLTVSLESQVSGNDIVGVPAEQNLIDTVLRAFEHRTQISPTFGWKLNKRIPIAAGLGGASSNAAGALLAANSLIDLPLPHADLVAIADEHGSDITFFLGPPCAIATGRGVDLEPLPPIEGDVLLVTPTTTLSNKTATMYQNLRTSDFSDGSSVDAIVELVRSQGVLSSATIRNAFLRPLTSLVPAAASAVHALDRMPQYPRGLTGAGPALFALAPREAHRELSDLVRASCGDSVECISTSFRTLGLQPYINAGIDPK